MKTITGIGVSPGISIGRAVVIKTSDLTAARDERIAAADVEREITRFHDAVQATIGEMCAIQERVAETVGRQHGDILSLHLALLRDKMLTGTTDAIIRDDQLTAESALHRALEKLAMLYQHSLRDFLQDRRRDVLDVFERLQFHLQGEAAALPRMKAPVIVIAGDLSPSRTAALDKDAVTGFATDVGSKTSHTAIMARALQVPAVVALGGISKTAQDGDIVIIDGTAGEVILKPPPAVIKKYRLRRETWVKEQKHLALLSKLPAQTTDGRKLSLHANIELPEEVATIRNYGAEGIGLYRTEFLYMNRTDIPSEEEQFQAYRKVAEAMGQRHVIIRTLDIGGDKFASSLQFPVEINPFLGWRAIRFCLQRRDIFEAQISAIFRAGLYGRLKILIPMISTLDEVRETKNFIVHVKKKLNASRTRFEENVDFGIMVEVPSAAIISDRLAREVAFFSIGTNDLIQYTVAVDRINEKITHLYQPCHPAVLFLIRKVIANADEAGIWTGLCGEMASIPEFAVLLLGMGISELSMASLSIPRVKDIIRKISYRFAAEVALHALTLDTHDEVLSHLSTSLKKELS